MYLWPGLSNKQTCKQVNKEKSRTNIQTSKQTCKDTNKQTASKWGWLPSLWSTIGFGHKPSIKNFHQWSHTWDSRWFLRSLSLRRWSLRSLSLRWWALRLNLAQTTTFSAIFFHIFFVITTTITICGPWWAGSMFINTGWKMYKKA